MNPSDHAARAGRFVEVPGLRKKLLPDRRGHCYRPGAVQQNEEVVPVNAVSTGVLPSGVTVGR
jgi:hypothetical protein